MKINHIFILLSLLFTDEHLFATEINKDIFFISSTPTPLSEGTFPTRLYSYDNNEQALNLCREVVSKQLGAEFLKVYYDERLIVIGSPPVKPDTVNILEMDDPMKEKSIKTGVFDKCPACSVLETHLVNLPNKQLAYTYFLGKSNSDITMSWGVDGNQIDYKLNDVVEIKAGGIPGGIISGDFFYIKVGSDSKLSIWVGREKLTTNWRLPENIIFSQSDNVIAYVNSNNMLVLSSRDNKQRSTAEELGKSTYYVFNKRSSKWKIIGFPGGRTEVRGLNEWLVGYVADIARKTQSPGSDRRRKHMAETGTPIDWRFDSANVFFSGILMLHNINTGKEYKIITSQGDSEILWVNDSYVYYRVNDELIKARILDQTIDTGQVLAKEDFIADIHWAFEGR
ncbi:hypothetical protein HC024_18245 [Methylococcaceae bacterium WWC4]|nr:hypothetical protein [Methylococcaceae bacterium WWC4]